MCGRSCMTLEPSDIVCACKYSTIDGAKELKKEPDYRYEYNLGRKYEYIFICFLLS
jgi:hypothetical protein